MTAVIDKRLPGSEGTSTPWKIGGPLNLSREELVRHVAIFGSTGSAKTRGVVLPILEDVLRVSKDDPDHRPGALVIDAKADMLAHLRLCLQRADRTDPLHIVGEGGNLTLAPLESFYPNGRAAIEFIIRLTQYGVTASGNNEVFWLENSKRLLRHALVLAWARHGREVAFNGILSALHDLMPRSRPEAGKQYLENEINRLRNQGRLHVEDANEIIASCTNDGAWMSRSTTGTIVANAVAYLEPFLGSEISQLLIQPGRSSYSPGHILDRGDVVLAALAPTLFGPTSRSWRNLVKDQFQGCALRRTRLHYFDGKSSHPVNQTRLAFLVMDEFHSLVRWGVDSGDPSFLDRAREFSVACLWACQGISALRAALPSSAAVDHLLNNSGTKIFMKTSCPATIEYACRLGALAERSRPAPLFLRNVNLRSVEVTPTALRNLAIGEGIVFYVDGRIQRVQFPNRDY